MSKDEKKKPQQSEEYKIYFSDDIPEDVLVDEVAEELPTAARPPSSWGLHPPFRRPEGLAGAEEEAVESESQKKRGILSRVLFFPIDVVKSLSQFILYSGMTRRSALSATLRLIAVMIPAFISIYLSYLSISTIFPRYTQVAAGSSALIAADENAASFTIGSSRLRIPLPDGFEVIPLDEYHRAFPLTSEAAMADGGSIVFAARSTNPDEESYFINVAADNATAGTVYTEVQFRRLLTGASGVVQKKEIQGSMQLGPNQVIGPFDQQPLSVCYGRMMNEIGLGQKTPSTLRQYSCMLFLEGKVVVLNVGYSFSVSGGKPGNEGRCKAILASWRNDIMK